MLSFSTVDNIKQCKIKYTDFRLSSNIKIINELLPYCLFHYYCFKLCLLVCLSVLIDLYNSSLIQQYESNLYYYPTTGLYHMRNTSSDSATYHIEICIFLLSSCFFVCVFVCLTVCILSLSVCVCVCVCVIENNRNGSRTGFEPAQSKYITTANPAC